MSNTSLITSSSTIIDSDPKNQLKNKSRDQDSPSRTSVSNLKDTIANLINEIVEENQIREDLSLKHSNCKHAKSKDLNTYFISKSKKIPKISIIDFYDRLVHYTKLEESTLILSLMYLDRICEIGHIKLSTYNIHRLILCSIITAIKYQEDDICSDIYYSKVGGVSLDELSKIEEEFLKRIKYTLFVKEEDFTKYQSFLVEYTRKGTDGSQTID